MGCITKSVTDGAGKFGWMGLQILLDDLVGNVTTVGAKIAAGPQIPFTYNTRVRLESGVLKPKRRQSVT